MLNCYFLINTNILAFGIISFTKNVGNEFISSRQSKLCGIMICYKWDAKYNKFIASTEIM